MLASFATNPACLTSPLFAHSPLMADVCWCIVYCGYVKRNQLSNYANYLQANAKRCDIGQGLKNLVETYIQKWFKKMNFSFSFFYFSFLFSCRSKRLILVTWLLKMLTMVRTSTCTTPLTNASSSRSPRV